MTKYNQEVREGASQTGIMLKFALSSEPVRSDVAVGTDYPDVGEALALLAQLRHARDVRVVAREELHLRGRPRRLQRRGGRFDVHLDGHVGGRRRGKWSCGIL